MVQAGNPQPGMVKELGLSMHLGLCSFGSLSAASLLPPGCMYSVSFPLGEILKSCEREVCACSKDSERYLLLLLLLARFLYGGGSPGLQALKVLFGDSSGSVR